MTEITNLREANKSRDSPLELLIPAEGYIAAAVILFLIGFLGFILNLSVIIFILKKRQLWTPMNMILLNLVVSDFLVSVLGNPWTFLAAVNYNWIFGRIGCILYGFIMSLLGITSITTLAVLAFERYMIIAQPFRNYTLNFRNTGVLVLSIWLYSLSLTIPPIVGWGEYVNESANISCSVNWEKKSTNSMTYILYLFTFGLFVPLVVITFSYAKIISTLRQNALRMGQVTKAESKVACMILVMIIAFVVAWSPYAILALIIQFGNSSFVTPGIGVFPALLAKSSICYNPIIYIGLNAQFRQIWKKPDKKNKAISSCDVLATTRIFSLEPAGERTRDTNELLVNKANIVTGSQRYCEIIEHDVTVV